MLTISCVAAPNRGERTLKDQRNNSGYWNSGNWNSGYWNSGNWNSGNGNSGNWNSGNWNSGNWNSGNWNSGNGNSGNWNSGNWNSGYFCEGTPSPTFFDLPCDLSWDEARQLIPWVDLPIGCEWVSESEMSEQEKAENPNYATIGGYLKKHELPINESFPLAWEKLDDETKQRFLDLPNFDAEKFLRITGVDIRGGEPEKSPVEKTIVLEGVEYRLVPV